MLLNVAIDDTVTFDATTFDATKVLRTVTLLCDTTMTLLAFEEPM